jgi:glutamate dehydrogenase
MVMEHKRRTGSVVGFKWAEERTDAQLLAEKVDVLVPAALERVITASNVEAVKARMVLELANGPVGVGAEKILLERGVVVVPDILVNAGGVTVSWLEWVQNLCGDVWTEEQINRRMEQMLVRATEEVEQMVVEKQVGWRMAAYMVAVQRVVEAMRLRGWV